MKEHITHSTITYRYRVPVSVGHIGWVSSNVPNSLLLECQPNSRDIISWVLFPPLPVHTAPSMPELKLLLGN